MSNPIFPKKYQWGLWPFSMLYGAGVSIHNGLYARQLLKPVVFDLPIISVGNLSVGGAGKTPHTEYLVRLLSPYLQVATLSRGYKRKTKGFRMVTTLDNAHTVGDEPLQFKRKFPQVEVAVGESRILAVPDLLAHNPDIQVIILDDAFQHRAIKPGLNLLLTPYSLPYTRDLLLPAGRLREWPSAAKRADIIIVTKCPLYLDQADREQLTKEINPLPHQSLFFSHYRYGFPYFLFNSRYRIELTEEMEILLVSAIANTDYLLDYLFEQVADVHSLEFEDHHYFTEHDMGRMAKMFKEIPTEKKLILTTEKDATRLLLHSGFIKQAQLPIFALPLEVEFSFGEGLKFEEQIRNFLLDFKS